jgi:hypothetical protein
LKGNTATIFSGYWPPGWHVFAAWRFLQCAFDLERHGSNLYGLMRRSVLAGSSLFYIALAAATIRITLVHQRVSEDQSAREWTEWVMQQHLGRVLITLIGWLLLIRGAARILITDTLMGYAKTVIRKKQLYPVSGGVLVIPGLVLCYFGYVA